MTEAEEKPTADALFKEMEPEHYKWITIAAGVLDGKRGLPDETREMMKGKGAMANILSWAESRYPDLAGFSNNQRRYLYGALRAVDQLMIIKDRQAEFAEEGDEVAPVLTEYFVRTGMVSYEQTLRKRAKRAPVSRLLGVKVGLSPREIEQADEGVEKLTTLDNK